MIVFFLATAASLILCGLIWRAFVDIQPSPGSSREWQAVNGWEDLEMAGVRGRLFKAPQPKGWLCLLHNWGASKNRFYPVADDLASEGFHVFLYDLPGHGTNLRSHPWWIFGLVPRLVDELCCVVQALSTRADCQNLPGGLLGYSFGSFIALEAFKQVPSVRSLACDSGPFSLSQRAIRMLVDRHLPHRPAWYRAFTTFWFCFAVNLPRRHAVLKNLAACAGRDLLLVENERETFIPLGEVHALAAQWPGPVTHWRVARAQHVMAYSVDRQEYRRRTADFLKGPNHEAQKTAVGEGRPAV